MAATRSVIVFSAIVLLCKGSASKSSQSVSVAREDADGERLIQLGKTFNNSMLKLIGYTFENLEENVVHKLCHKTPCTLWSNWSNCTAEGPSSFGFQTRGRKCWYNSTDPCSQDGAVTIETASKVCERPCGLGYSFTKHGFCLKFHVTILFHLEAEQICKAEGGHIMNVDTKERLIDFTKIANTTGFIWVDGMRANNTTPYRYRTGRDPFVNRIALWNKAEPQSTKDELCLITRYMRGTMYWHDGGCTWKVPFVCEIR